MLSSALYKFDSLRYSLTKNQSHVFGHQKSKEGNFTSRSQQTSLETPKDITELCEVSLNNVIFKPNPLDEWGEGNEHLVKLFESCHAASESLIAQGQNVRSYREECAEVRSAARTSQLALQSVLRSLQYHRRQQQPSARSALASVERRLMQLCAELLGTLELATVRFNVYGQLHGWRKYINMTRQDHTRNKFTSVQRELAHLAEKLWSLTALLPPPDSLHRHPASSSNYPTFLASSNPLSPSSATEPTTTSASGQSQPPAAAPRQHQQHQQQLSMPQDLKAPRRTLTAPQDARTNPPTSDLASSLSLKALGPDNQREGRQNGGGGDHKGGRGRSVRTNLNDRYAALEDELSPETAARPPTEQSKGNGDGGSWASPSPRPAITSPPPLPLPVPAVGDTFPRKSKNQHQRDFIGTIGSSSLGRDKAEGAGGGGGTGLRSRGTSGEASETCPWKEEMIITPRDHEESSGGKPKAGSRKCSTGDVARGGKTGGVGSSPNKEAGREGGGGGGGGRVMSLSPSAGLEDVRWEVNFEELELKRLLGEGSCGRVWHATWFHTEVAVKQPTGVMDAEECDLRESRQFMRRSFHHEANVLMSLRHPNVVMFMGVSLSPLSIVTEFCSRGSLWDLIQKSWSSGGKGSAAPAARGGGGGGGGGAGVRLDWPRRLALAVGAARGMNYLHSHNPPIIHRDLKSANLCVDKNWTVKVCDFGLSKVMVASVVPGSVSLTSPRWMAPEVLAGDPYSKSADVFSFGVVLWELLTLQVPWEEMNSWQIMHTVVEMQERLPLNPGPQDSELSGVEEVRDLIRECFSAPADRPSFSTIIPRLTILRDQAVKVAKGAGYTPTNKPSSSPRKTDPASNSNQMNTASQPQISSGNENGTKYILREPNSPTISSNIETLEERVKTPSRKSSNASIAIMDKFLDSSAGIAT